MANDPSRALDVARKLVEILADDEPFTRQRAIQIAMMLLGDNLDQPADGSANPSGGEHHRLEFSDLAEFFNRDEKLKPSEYAQLCAAYHYSHYGSAAFSLAELREIAIEAGVVIPDRLDMTLRQAAKNGRTLFHTAGKSFYKPTASARLLFEERWNVKPGKLSKSHSGSSV